MTVVDIHTHMLSRAYLALLEEAGAGYAVGEAPGGRRAVYRGTTAFLTLTEAMLDYGLRLEAMDAAGVDLAVVSLTSPNVFFGDEATSVRAARLVNDEMAAAAAAHPDRLRFLASLPWQHPAAAVEELGRARGLGAVGVMVLANVDGVSLTAEQLAPVWQAIDEQALPVLVHPSTPPGLELLDLDRYHLVWSVGFPMDTTLALARMVMDGFFDRYRRLTVIGSHAGGALPFLLGRLDAGPRYFPAARDALGEVAPSAFAGRLYVDSITYSPEALRFTVDTLGADHVLFGSDFPHPCGRMDEALALVGTLPAGSAAQVRSANAERLFSL